jgi:type VI secretion system secreted protein Hcp
MAIDYFLQIDGIEGESQDAKHKAWIDLLSWSWGESHAAAPEAGGGGGSGRVSMQDVHFAMPMSKASPRFFLACASGRHHKEAVLVGRKGGKDPQEFMTWTFSDVLVTSYQTSGSEAQDGPFDQVSLNFTKVRLDYKAQKADGSLDAPISAGWDVIANKKL